MLETIVIAALTCIVELLVLFILFLLVLFCGSG